MSSKAEWAPLTDEERQAVNAYHAKLHNKTEVTEYQYTRVYCLEVTGVASFYATYALAERAYSEAKDAGHSTNHDLVIYPIHIRNS